MGSYDSMLKEIHDRAMQDSILYGTAGLGLPPHNRPAGPDAIDLTARAIERVPELQRAGELTPAAVELFDALLRQQSVPPGVMDLISEVNLAAAEALGNIDLIRQAALTRCIALRLLMLGDPEESKAHPEALRRISRIALEIAEQWDLGELDPDLVADLHLVAGTYK
jgi:hypothetical protein